MRGLIATAAAIAAAAPFTALAQPGVAEPTESDGDRSPGLALGLAIGGTAVGYGAVLYGLRADEDAPVLIGFAAAAVGPSFGHVYAGEIGRGVTHFLVRAGGALLVVAGVREYYEHCLGQEGDDCDGRGKLMIGAGALLAITSSVYSIIDAPRAARRQNAARRVTLMPAPVSGPDGSTGLALQLGGAF